MDQSYKGSLFKRTGKRPRIIDERIPPMFKQLSVEKNGTNHIYFVCTHKLFGTVECDFCIRKDIFTKRIKAGEDIDDILSHKHISQTLERFGVPDKKVSTPIEECIFQFCASANLSFRQIDSKEFKNLIEACINEGKAHNEEDTETLIPSIERHVFRKNFIQYAECEFNTLLKQYEGKIGSCLTADAGKHHTRPYLIICLSNALFHLPSLVLEAVRYFKGTKVSYANELQKVAEDLTSRKIKIVALVTDNLKAQKAGVDHASDSCFQKKSTVKEVNSIIWISCACHSISLALNDITSCSAFGIYQNELSLTVSFLRSKKITNIIQKHCPGFSKTRWTGTFDCAAWIVKNQQLIKEKINEQLSKETCIDIDDNIIHALFFYATAIFVFLLPLKTLILKLEAENCMACYAYPMVQRAIADTKRNIIEFGLPGSLAVELQKSINRRMVFSPSGRILSFLFLCTPLGRQMTRSESNDNGLIIHGDMDASVSDESISLNYNESDIELLETIRENSLDFYRHESSIMREAFASYKGILTHHSKGSRVIHETLGEPTEDDPLSEEEVDAAIQSTQNSAEGNYSRDESDADLPIPPLEDSDGEREIVEEQNSGIEVNINYANESHEDDESLESEEEDGYDSDSTDDDQDQDFDEYEGTLHDEGIILNCFATIGTLGVTQGLSQESINVLKAQFSSWLTDDISVTTSNSWLLTQGLKIWEVKASEPSGNELARFILPYFGIVASEALVERCFWYQRRIIGDTGMRMSNDVEKARMNLILLKNKK